MHILSNSHVTLGCVDTIPLLTSDPTKSSLRSLCHSKTGLSQPTGEPLSPLGMGTWLDLPQLDQQVLVTKSLLLDSWTRRSRRQ